LVAQQIQREGGHWTRRKGSAQSPTANEPARGQSQHARRRGLPGSGHGASVASRPANVLATTERGRSLGDQAAINCRPPQRMPSRCGCGRVRGVGRPGRRGGGRWRCASAGKAGVRGSGRCGWGGGVGEGELPQRAEVRLDGLVQEALVGVKHSSTLFFFDQRRIFVPVWAERLSRIPRWGGCPAARTRRRRRRGPGSAR
jgi:hypothetical protein